MNNRKHAHKLIDDLFDKYVGATVAVNVSIDYAEPVDGRYKPLKWKVSASVDLPKHHVESTKIDAARNRLIEARVNKSMESGTHNLDEAVIRILCEETPAGWVPYRGRGGIRPFFGTGVICGDEVEPTYSGMLEYYEQQMKEI